MKQFIADIINEYNTPGVSVEVADTDKYDCEQIEIRRNQDGRLVWRAWDYEPGFADDLHRELSFHHSPVL